VATILGKDARADEPSSQPQRQSALDAMSYLSLWLDMLTDMSRNWVAKRRWFSKLAPSEIGINVESPASSKDKYSIDESLEFMPWNGDGTGGLEADSVAHLKRLIAYLCLAGDSADAWGRVLRTSFDDLAEEICGLQMDEAAALVKSSEITRILELEKSASVLRGVNDWASLDKGRRRWFVAVRGVDIVCAAIAPVMDDLVYEAHRRVVASARGALVFARAALAVRLREPRTTPRAATGRGDDEVPDGIALAGPARGAYNQIQGVQTDTHEAAIHRLDAPSVDANAVPKGTAEIGGECTDCTVEYTGAWVGQGDPCPVCSKLQASIAASRAPGARTLWPQSRSRLWLTTPWEMAKVLLSGLGNHAGSVLSSQTCDTNQANLFRTWSEFQTAGQIRGAAEWDALKRLVDGDAGTGAEGLRNHRNTLMHAAEKTLDDVQFAAISALLRAIVNHPWVHEPGLEPNRHLEKLDEWLDQARQQ
jgi:hypothetical protein